MQPIPATDVYFTVDGQGAVTAIKINDGEIIQRKVFSQSQLPPAWVNALHEMIASMDANPIEPRSISFLQQHSSHTLAFDQTCFAPTDMGHGPSGTYIDQFLDAPPYPTLPLEAEARTAESGVVFPFDIPALSDSWDLPDPFDMSCVPVLPENPPIGQIPGEPNTQSPGASVGSESRPMGLKRAQKLHRMLGALENHEVASKEDHNRQIEGLYNGPQLFSCSQDMSMVQFAAVLGKHSSVSSAVGTIYGLLSWNIFGLEEDRLVKNDRLSPYIAAKQMNQKMTSALRRRGKSSDWASDGRRAAKAVFGVLEGVSTNEQSFALILLAETFSLDYLLKIAHFPSLRLIFREQFARIIKSRTAEWERCLENGYKVFDYQAFLRLRSHSLPGYDLGSQDS